MQDIKRIRLIVTFTIILIVSLAGYFKITIDIRMLENDIKNEYTIMNKQIESIYNNIFTQLNISLISRLKYLSMSPTIKEALKKNNPKILQKLVETRFNLIKQSIPTAHNIRIFNADGKEFYTHTSDVVEVNYPKIVKYTKKVKHEVSGFSRYYKDSKKVLYKLMLPVYDNNKIIGFIAFGIDIDFLYANIADNIKSILNINITPYIFLDKLKIKQNLKTYMQLGNYIAPITQDNKLLNLTIKKINYKPNQTHYYINIKDKHYHLFISDIQIKDFSNQNIGKLIYVIDATNIKQIKNDKIFNIIKYPIAILTTLIILINLLFNYFHKKLLNTYKMTRRILDTQDALIVITDGKNMVECNKAVLDFFGFKSYSEFKHTYSCISKLFTVKKDFLVETVNDTLWSKYIVQHNNSVHKVLLVDKNDQEHIFEVKGKDFVIDNDKTNNHIFIFNDITLLEKEKENSTKKEKLLFEQSKMASMGEMIGNIAHQWRQPLTIISSIATGADIKLEMGLLDNKELSQWLQTINTNVQYLSKTIDDFRDFFKTNKTKEKYLIENVIEQTLTLSYASLKNNDIDVIKNIKDEIEIEGYPNEIIQALLNIISNAKDVLKDKDDEKLLFITGYKHTNFYTIEILDNGGGISDKHINRIFEPYFTTKHKSQGTGIGLYMTYQILTEHIKGDIEVQNKIFTYNDIEYQGANFTIKIPID